MNQHSRIAAAPVAGPARFSAREFERMIDAGAFDDMKVELIGGELDRMPPPQTLHANWQVRLIASLLSAIDKALLLGEVGIVLADDTLVGCDVAVVTAPVADDRRLRPEEVALAVEVAVSSIGRDLGLKRALYAAAGIDCYWVVDPDRGVTHVYREPVAGEYRTVATVPFDQPLAVPGGSGAITLA